MAIFLPMALPPMVNDDTMAVINIDNNIKFVFNILLKLLAIVMEQAPDTTPHISPITSLQKLDNLSVFCLNLTANLAPFTFLEAIELNTLISEAVTDTPIISNITPINININTIIMPIVIGTNGNNISSVVDNISDNIKVIIIILIIHLMSAIFFLFFFSIFFKLVTSSLFIYPS